MKALVKAHDEPGLMAVCSFACVIWVPANHGYLFPIQQTG